MEDFDPQNIDADLGVVTERNVAQFKNTYEKAVSSNIQTFRFEGRIYSVADAEFALKNMGEL